MMDSATNSVKAGGSQRGDPGHTSLRASIAPEQVSAMDVKALVWELAEAQDNTAKLQRQFANAQIKIEAQDARIKELTVASVAVNELTLQQLQQLGENDQVNIQLIRELERLESQLHISRQRTAEQEDALLHWQELAETTQTQLKKIKKERKTWRRQLEESILVANKLREKNSRIEYEWQRTLMELNNLRDRMPEEHVETMRAALVEARQEIRSLKAVIADFEEQRLWYKANLKTVQGTLEQSHALSSSQELLLDNEGRETEIAVLKKAIHHKSAQIDAYNAEIEHHLEQMTAQGQRLAEIQALLIERELQLEQIEERSKVQSEFIKRLKQVADKRIQHLEAQLDWAKQRLERQAPRQ